MHGAGVAMAMAAGDEGQAARDGRLAAGGGKLFTVGFTEPGSGSHFLAPQAVAERVWRVATGGRGERRSPPAPARRGGGELRASSRFLGVQPAP